VKDVMLFSVSNSHIILDLQNLTTVRDCEICHFP